MNDTKILIVDDEVIITLSLKTFLKKGGYTNVALAHSGEEALELAQQFQPDLILMDIMLPGDINGLEAAQKINATREVPTIFISGNIEILKGEELPQRTAVLSKPVTTKRLLATLEKILGH